MSEKATSVGDSATIKTEDLINPDTGELDTTPQPIKDASGEVIGSVQLAP